MALGVHLLCVCVGGGRGLVACPGMGLAVQRDQAAKLGLGAGLGFPRDRKSWQDPGQGVCVSLQPWRVCVCTRACLHAQWAPGWGMAVARMRLGL